MALTPTDLDNAEIDLQTTSIVANSKTLAGGATDTTITRLGDTADTLNGRLKKLGYIPPIAYAGGIVFTALDNVKTVDESGSRYAPKVGELPFTTSGTWIGDDEDKFYLIEGARVPQLSAEFADISNLVGATSLNAGAVNWSDYEGREVNVVVNNTTSKSCGAPYIIKTVAQAAADGDAIDGTGSPNYLGRNHALDGGTHVAILNASGDINAGHFGPIKNNTDCVATINKALEYAKTKVVDGKYTPTVTIPFVGTIIIDSASILFPRNVVVDLGKNRYKLANGASKYLFSQDDLVTDDFVGSAGGSLEIYNFIIDGNATGGQSRNLVGTDVRDMYCGFGALFFGLNSLKVHNFKCVDTEAWGFAHFKCRDTEWHTGVFDQDETRIGLNGDGITGISARTHIYNMAGYTNDDLFAIGTTRASIGGVQVWNDGIDVEIFNVHDIEMFDKSGKSCHFACGAYPSDGFTINQWTMKNISGNCENGMWRAGNYFNPLGATDGLIENIVESNMSGYSRTGSQGQRNLFRVAVYQASISEFRNVVDANTGSNQFLRIVTGSVVNALNVTNGSYQQVYVGGLREGVIYVDSSSELKQLTASDVFHSLTSAQLPAPENFTFLRNFGARPKLNLSSITKGEADGGNLNQEKDDFFVSDTGALAGALNVKWTEDITVVSANYTEASDMQAVYENGIVTMRGTAISAAGSITIPNQNNALSRPDWAKPRDADISFGGTYSKNGGGAGGSESCLIIVRHANTDIDFYHISGNPLDSYISISGLSYEADPALL